MVGGAAAARVAGAFGCGRGRGGGSLGVALGGMQAAGQMLAGHRRRGFGWCRRAGSGLRLVWSVLDGLDCGEFRRTSARVIERVVIQITILILGSE